MCNIAHDLRVSVRSVQRWRKAWSQGGPGALASKGLASLLLLGDELFAVLERELLKGPVAHGRPDLNPVTDQDPDRAPVPQELHHPGRGRAAQTAWLELPGPRPPHDRAGRGGGGRLGEGDLAAGGRTVAALDAWLVFEDEAGFSVLSPTTRTWSRRGHILVVRVRGRSHRRLSVAALVCYKPGECSRLIYRPCPDARPEERKSFSWKPEDYASSSTAPTVASRAGTSSASHHDDTTL